MNLHGIEIDVRNRPPLDETFLPLARWNAAFLKMADRPFSVAVEREDGLVSVYDTFLHGTESMREADAFYALRLVKCLLWMRGGFRVTVCGNDEISSAVAKAFAPGGANAFDVGLMADVYGRPFEVRTLPLSQKPAAKERAGRRGGQPGGCRVGLDAGGSNLKYAAVKDGTVIFTGETPWNPVGNSNPAYHEERIVAALRQAASHLPRVDAVGVSSAGIFVGEKARVSSIFRSVPKEVCRERVGDIYQRAARALGDVPVHVANDGDVTALAGAMELDAGDVLGISMGTSQAGGYVDGGRAVTGWLNELAFVPVDAQLGAARDPWSGDVGCGVEYLAQDAALRLAPRAGIALPQELSPALRVKELQKLLESGQPCARRVFETMGCYLGHAVPLYANFYPMKHVLLLGGMMRGKGGAVILETARKVLETEYLGVAKVVQLGTLSDQSRRAGQSVAAAFLG